MGRGCTIFNNVVCFCDYCKEKKFDLCDDYEEDMNEFMRQVVAPFRLR